MSPSRVASFSSMGGCCSSATLLQNLVPAVALSLPPLSRKSGNDNNNSGNNTSDNQNNDDKKAIKAKVLVLGAAGAGKSTLIRHIRIINNHDFSDDEIGYFSKMVKYATLEALGDILMHPDFITKEARTREWQNLVENYLVLKGPGNDHLDKMPDRQWNKLIRIALKIWREPVVQESIAEKLTGNLPFLQDPKPYFLTSIEHIMSKEYKPSHEDILSLRLPTKGTNHTLLKFDQLTITMIDVGGHRSERRKWLHCFESVTSVLFVASLSEYDEMTEEGPAINRVIESLNLFESVCNVRWFSHAAMLLFLNKKDLFAEKIKNVSLTVAFPEYDGSVTSYTEASEYIWKRFESRCKSRRDIYRHFTCAKDKSNVAKVFATIRDDIVKNTLDNVGFS